MTRTVYEEDGHVYDEYRTADVSPIFDEVREAREGTNLAGMPFEFIGSIPLDLMNLWHSQGFPVFDADEGHACLNRLLADKDYEYLSTGRGRRHRQGG